VLQQILKDKQAELRRVTDLPDPAPIEEITEVQAVAPSKEKDAIPIAAVWALILVFTFALLIRI
jgi:hypothetical protein